MTHPSDDLLLQLIRQHFNLDVRPRLIYTAWKDGIDVDEPSYDAKAFAYAVYEAGKAAAGYRVVPEEPFKCKKRSGYVDPGIIGCLECGVRDGEPCAMLAKAEEGK